MPRASFFLAAAGSIAANRICLAWSVHFSSRHRRTVSIRRLFDDDIDDVVVDDSTEPPVPPTPFRDETSFLFAGDVSSVDDSTSPIRQSLTSPHPLLSPPRPIPNPYGWMRDDSRTNATVLDHLRAENAYGKRMTAHLKDLKEQVYQEILSYIEETDYTTPALKRVPGENWWYYTRYEEGESYPRYCRARASKDDLYPPPVNPGWNKKVTNSNNESHFPPVLAGEEVYLDVITLARNRTYCAVGDVSISPNQRYIAYSLDEKGGETCQIYVSDTETGDEWVLLDISTGYSDDGGENNNPLECEGSIVWDSSSRGIFYTLLDEAQRPYKVYYRQIIDSDGHWITEQKEEVILEEQDESFNVRISKTFDLKYFRITCSSKESAEVHYIDLSSEDGGMGYNGKLRCIAKRQSKVLYRVYHCRGYWLVCTNIGDLPNFSLKACRVGEEGMDKWRDVVSSSDIGVLPAPVFDGGHERTLDGVTVYNPETEEASLAPYAYAVVTGREEGIPRVWVIEFGEETSAKASATAVSPLKASRMTRLEFDESAYDAGIGAVRDPSLPYTVISYDSLVTPPSHIAIPLSNPKDTTVRKVLKQKEVAGYDKESYACERTTVRSRDGTTDIPVSLVYHRDILKERCNGPIPAHLFGYGSYGASIEASFRSTRLPLLNRNFVYAIAHARGGGELGRPWYDGARYLTKKNSFHDFVDVARWLVGEGAEKDALGRDRQSIGHGITSPSLLSCEGRSAGGLLIGASLNEQPDLFRAAILGVPFVDVACTMVDATIPLTVAEWEEWGNPNEENYFDYIMGYSPINNIKRGRKYPACLITGGLHDPRVQYWEPTKFAAELRHSTAKDSGPIVLGVDMASGHYSASDRYKGLREIAFDLAFLIDALGCSNR